MVIGNKANRAEGNGCFGACRQVYFDGLSALKEISLGQGCMNEVTELHLRRSFMRGFERRTALLEESEHLQQCTPQLQVYRGEL